MAQSSLRSALSVARRYVGPLIFLVAVILMLGIITMGVSGHLPKWFLALATIL